MVLWQVVDGYTLTDARYRDAEEREDYINGEYQRWMEQGWGRCMLCQLELSEDDGKFVCFLTGLDLVTEKNGCIGVSITVGWALPQGCRLEHSLWASLCVYFLICNLSFWEKYIIVLVQLCFFTRCAGITIKWTFLFERTGPQHVVVWWTCVHLRMPVWIIGS